MRFAVILIVLLCITSAPCLATDWVYDLVVNPYSGEYDYGCTSIALNANGDPMIAYSGTAMNPVPRIAHKDGATWISETVDANGYIGQRALALDALGRPHLLYSDVTDWQNPIVKYSHWTGSEWARQQIGSGYGFLRLDQDDMPHILYSGASGVMYTHWTGTEWATELVSGVVSASAADLALDADGNPRVLYHEGGGAQLRYAYKTGGDWTSEFVGEGGFCSLALDASGEPRVAHTSVSGMMYSYKLWDGESWIWSSEHVSDGGDYCSLALDSAGNPSICYQFCNPSDPSRQVKYSRKAGSWSTEVLRGASYMSLALDSVGNPHISCNGDNYAGLSYITGTVPEPSGLLTIACGLIFAFRARVRRRSV